MKEKLHNFSNDQRNEIDNKDDNDIENDKVQDKENHLSLANNK